MSTPNVVRNLGRSFPTGKRLLVALALATILLIPQSSQSQFIPNPCYAILSVGLSSIASALTSVIGGGLSAINATMSSIEAFERAVVWPQKLIDQAKAVVGAVHGI